MNEAHRHDALNAEDTVTDRLSDYLDGELAPAEHAAVERHLARCSECRVMLEELREVVTHAAALQDVGPEQNLWGAVAARIGGGRPSRVSIFRRAIAQRRFLFTFPQLAAAGLALVLLSGGIVWLSRSADPRAGLPPLSADAAPAGMVRPANFADAPYDEAIADLEQRLKQGRTTLDPETVRVLEDNLAAIDRAIDQCRRALTADPANVYLNGHLADARQRKLSLLRQASAFDSLGS